MCKGDFPCIGGLCLCRLGATVALPMDLDDDARVHDLRCSLVIAHTLAGPWWLEASACTIRHTLDQGECAGLRRRAVVGSLVREARVVAARLEAFPLEPGAVSVADGRRSAGTPCCFAAFEGLCLVLARCLR